MYGKKVEINIAPYISLYTTNLAHYTLYIKYKRRPTYTRIELDSVKRPNLYQISISQVNVIYPSPDIMKINIMGENLPFRRMTNISVYYLLIRRMANIYVTFWVCYLLIRRKSLNTEVFSFLVATTTDDAILNLPLPQCKHAVIFWNKYTNKW